MARASISGFLSGARLVAAAAALTFSFQASASSHTTITPTAGDPGDRFGDAVALFGDTAVVGAPGEDDNGAAHVLRWTGSGWDEEALLTAPDGAPGDEFGASVALSGDTVVIGAPGHAGAGAVYIFSRAAGAWQQEEKFSGAPGDEFGNAVAIDSVSVLVGAPGATSGSATSGAVSLFERDETGWALVTTFAPSDGASGDRFGASVDIDDGMAVVGAPGDDDLGAGSGAAYRFERASGVWGEADKFIASDGFSGHAFGAAVAIDDRLVLVGADGANGVAALGSGAAYVFGPTNGRWGQQGKLMDADGAANHAFGASVDLSGGVAVVGGAADDAVSPAAGSASVFTRDAGRWTQLMSLRDHEAPGEPTLGRAVAIDGQTVLTGAPSAGVAGAVLAFERVAPVWIGPELEVLAPDGAFQEYFGGHVAIEGDIAVVAATYADNKEGGAYIFERVGGVWRFETKLSPPELVEFDYFGPASISGDTILIASGNESAYVYVRDGGTWTQQARLFASDPAAQKGFGEQVALSGDVAIIGASRDDDAGPDAGAAYVFTRSGGVWSEQQKIVLPNPKDYEIFPSAIDLDGDIAVLGKNNNIDDEVYVFAFDGAAWVEEAVLSTSSGSLQDGFGRSVAIDGDTIVVGARRDDAAYVFERSPVGWAEVAKLAPSNPGDFGWSVAIDGDIIVVGAPETDTPIANDAGQVFVFSRAGGLWRESASPYLLDASNSSQERFGVRVAISDGTILAGAQGRAGPAAPAQGAAFFMSMAPGASPNSTAWNATAGVVEPSIADAVVNALDGDQLIAAYAAFETDDQLDFAGRAIDLDSNAEIRQPGAALWTLADGARLATPGGRTTRIAGSLAVPAGAAVTIDTDTLFIEHHAGLNAGAGAVLSIEGSFEARTRPGAAFDLSEAELQMLGGGICFLEAMNADIGPSSAGLTAGQDDRYPIGALRVSGEFLVLLDAHDNDMRSQSVRESIYVQDLVIDAGATLITNGHKVYYTSLVNNGTVDWPGNLVPISDCDGDLDFDGAIDGADLGLLLGAWGGPGATDLNGDGVTDGADLGLLLGAWGACP